MQYIGVMNSLSALSFTIIKGILRFRYPLFVSRINLYVRTLRPKTFSRKIAYKMFHDRNPVMTILADKLAVREYVSSRIDDKYLVRLLWSGSDLNDFQTITNLRNYVVKPNHGSHAAVIVSELASAEQTLPKTVRFSRWSQYILNPESVNLPSLVALTKYWMKLNYYWEPNKLPEWAYLQIQPRIMVEELLVGPKLGVPDEFRFFMIHGKCELIYRFSNRFGNEELTLFNPDGTIREGSYLGLSSRLENLKMPFEFSEMLTIAEKLSKDLDFIRVDLYITNQGIKFSELTNYPMGGLRKFSPRNLEGQLAKKWAQSY